MRDKVITSPKKIWVPKQLGSLSLVHSDIAEAPDSFVSGLPTANIEYVRVGRSEITLIVTDDFLDWLWSLYLNKFTPRIASHINRPPGVFPLNPWVVLSEFL